MSRINPYVKFDVDYLNETIPIEAVIREYAGIDVHEGSKKNIKCPFPNRTSVHKNGDKNASASVNHGNGKNFCYCHACGKGANPVSLAREYNPNMDFVDLLYKVAQDFGIPLEYCSDISERQQAKAEGRKIFTESFPLTWQEVEELGLAVSDKTEEELPKHSVTGFTNAAHAKVGMTQYHRGLSQATLDHFNVGFSESWTNPINPKFDKGNGFPRLIIPTSDHSYMARLASTDAICQRKLDSMGLQGEEREEFEKAIKCRKVGNIKLFNQEVLQTSTEPIFIAEGEIDAMSFYDVGCTAVGLGGTGSVERLLEVLAQDRPTQMLVIAADNDTAGTKAKQQLIEGLDKLGIEYIIPPNLYPNCKDANEALCKDREAFAQRAKEVKVFAMRMKSKERLIPEGVREAVDNVIAASGQLPNGTVSVQQMWREGDKDDKVAVEDALVEKINELLGYYKEMYEQCRQSYAETRTKYSAEQWEKNQKLLAGYTALVEQHPLAKLNRTPFQIQAINDTVVLNWTEKFGREASEKIQHLTEMREKVVSQQVARERFYKEQETSKRKQWGKG